jgi:hypothetical protein
MPYKSIYSFPTKSDNINSLYYTSIAYGLISSALLIWGMHSIYYEGYMPNTRKFYALFTPIYIVSLIISKVANEYYEKKVIFAIGLKKQEYIKDTMADYFNKNIAEDGKLIQRFWFWCQVRAYLHGVWWTWIFCIFIIAVNKRGG